MTVRTIMAWLFVCGLLLIVGGCAMIYPPAAFIVGGTIVAGLSAANLCETKGS